MQSILSMSPLLRAIGVIGVVALLVTSVTFAALSSSAELTGNTIASATADLEVSSDATCATSGTFSDSEAGFSFTGVVPGGGAFPTPAEIFCLDNVGDVDLVIDVSIPSTPTTSGPGTVDLTKVNVVLSCTDANETYTLDESIDTLVTGAVAMSGGDLASSDLADCDAQVSMDSDAVTGESATVDAFDLVFTGTQTP